MRQSLDFEHNCKRCLCASTHTMFCTGFCVCVLGIGPARVLQSGPGDGHDNYATITDYTLRFVPGIFTDRRPDCIKDGFCGALMKIRKLLPEGKVPQVPQVSWTNLAPFCSSGCVPRCFATGIFWQCLALNCRTAFWRYVTTGLGLVSG
jgi:hypothetical protein